MFDGNGNWTSDFSAQADRDNGIKILASRFDNIFIADIKESFENCLTKDGQIAPIGNFNMGGQKITNLNNGVNDNDAVNMSQLNNTISNLLSSLYPVGSIYIGTQNTCPLASLISGSQWELVSTNLITDVNNTASLSVYGNGKAIGVYSDNIGVGGLTSHGDYGSVGIKVGNYNTTASGTASRVGWNHGVALSTDASTSGITGTANISSTKLTVNVWRRTA